MSAQFDVLVIGGGAAGLMAALTAGQRGRRVAVVEHANRCGKKILMSGGGRCNFTNTGTTPNQFISSNKHFCKSALARFTPADFIELVDRHGIGWHEKELGQLFCDESSRDIVNLLLRECEYGEVTIKTSCNVERVSQKDGQFVLHTSQGVLTAAKLIVATGGLSIPRMGATGFGFELARQFGHSVLPTRAGLVPLTQTGSHADDYAELAGVALPVVASNQGVSFSNAMLFTHRGISGPSILQISSYWQPGDDLRLDLLPEVDALALLQAEQRARPAAELKTVLADVLPKRFAHRLCERWFGSKPMRQYDVPSLKAIAMQLKTWPIVASGTEGYRTAEVTLGGVNVDEVSSSTMESRLVPGLYFVGEVLDVTGWLGGYNFQWAWASGRAAGMVV